MLFRGNDRRSIASTRRSAQPGARIEIVAPLSGKIVPLERVPDPVFSNKMIGDGVAIDPVDSILRSPCSGVIAQIHSGGHAVTVRTREGIEILLHVGLDTVNLRGTGFTARVKAGERVSVGTALIEFDLDYIARHAKSTLTLVVVITMERVSIAERVSGHVSGGTDRIFVLEPG